MTLTTNLKNDEGLDLTGVYALEIDENRNGNLNLVHIGTERKVVMEFQNNDDCENCKGLEKTEFEKNTRQAIACSECDRVIT